MNGGGYPISSIRIDRRNTTRLCSGRVHIEAINSERNTWSGSSKIESHARPSMTGSSWIPGNVSEYRTRNPEQGEGRKGLETERLQPLFHWPCGG
jgi:hypothetical protein